MLYLGIDQHARQLTVDLRYQSEDVLLRRQVSTRPDKILAFFESLTRQCLEQGCEFWAIVEVCGFNDWLIEMLRSFRCARIVLVQPESSLTGRSYGRHATMRGFCGDQRDRYQPDVALIGAPWDGGSRDNRISVCQINQAEGLP